MRPAAVAVALVAVLCATLVGACEQAKPSATPPASVAVRASEAPAASPSTEASTSAAAVSTPTAQPSSTPLPTPTATPVPATPAATPTPIATATAASGDRRGTWLVMIYQNADDEILEQDIFTDLNEAELVGSTDRVTIVAQLDRFDGAFDGDGDWTGARRFLVGQDDDLDVLASEELEDLGEVDSGDWQTLSDFATWAIESFPADHYALILSDHGAGWVGGWNDNAPREGSAFTTDDIDRCAPRRAHAHADRPSRPARVRRLPDEPGRGARGRHAVRARGRGVGGGGARARVGLQRLPRRAGRVTGYGARRAGPGDRRELHLGRRADHRRRRTGAAAGWSTSARART